MRRITISLDDELARIAESEVKAGRAPSVSAWVADAIRAKARARVELVADLEDQERNDPTPPVKIASIARVLGLSPSAVTKVLRGRRDRGRGRRAA